MNGGGMCYRCNRSGHFARNCRDTSSVSSSSFSRGGRRGGGSRGGIRGGSNVRDREINCYKCNRVGHIARDCKDEDRCYRCDGSGHIARECPQSIGGLSCYKCHMIGHLARNCPDPDERAEHGSGDDMADGGSSSACYNCNKIGHFSRDCTESRNGGSENTFTCHKCSVSGHKARDCPESNKLICYNCGEEGHISRECRTSCRTRWDNISDNSLRENKTVSGQKLTNIKQDKYSQQLGIITKFFEERDKMTNIDYDVTTKDNAGHDDVDLESGQYENEENSLGYTKEFVNPVIVEFQSHTSSNSEQNCFTSPTPRNKIKPSVSDAPPSKTATATDMEYLIKKNENIQPLALHHPVDAFLSGIAPVLKKLPPHDWHYAKSDIFATVQNYEFKMMMQMKDQSSEPSSTRTFYEQPTSVFNLASTSATSSFTKSPGDQSQDSSYGAFQQYN